MIPINEPKLHVLVFAPLAPDTGDAEKGLARTWAAASRLGIAERAPELDRPVELPLEWPSDDLWFQLVAAKTDSDGGNKAIAFTAHDVAAVAVRLTTTATTDGDALGDLSQTWRNAAGDNPLDGVLGAAHIFTGSTNEPAVSLITSAAEVTHKVLAAHAGSGLETEVAVEPGIAIWQMEAHWGPAVVALAGPEAATPLEGWCWLTAGNDDVGRLVRYYMHATKLRFEFGVFREGIPELRAKQREQDAGLDKLFALHQRFEKSGAVAGELIDAQSQLSRAQGDATGLLISITHLRDLRQTVEIAAHSLRGYEPSPLTGAGSTKSPFKHELALSEWLDGQISHDVSYFESCRERVREAQALTDLRLQQVAAERARTANALNVLQTSMLAALLGTFGLVSTLSHAVPSQVRAALLGLVASGSLVLPTLAGRWPNGYAWPELTAIAVVGAAAGWVCAVLASSVAPLAVVLAAATLGAIIAAQGARLANARRRHLRR